VRLALLVLVLLALVLVPFFLWGAEFEALFDAEGAAQWIRARGALGPAAVVALLVADLALPVPGTLVISAAGFVYGVVGGGLLGAAGSFAAGAAAYLLARLAGERGARWILGERELARTRAHAARLGPWVIALSRWMPVLPEITSVLAGLTAFDARRYFAALALGSLPMGFAYAAIGAAGRGAPALAIAASVALPAVLLGATRRWWRAPAA